MTRRERRGTIVLLMLMAVIIMLSTIIGYRHENMPQSQTAAQLESFERQTDTTVFTVEKAKPHKTGKKEKPTSDKPRRLDPVPQF